MYFSLSALFRFHAFIHTLYRERANESENQDAKSYENTFSFVSADSSDHCEISHRQNSIKHKEQIISVII